MRFHKKVTFNPSPMKKYFLHGKLVAKSGQASQLAQILLEASKIVEKEKGCRLYAISTDSNKKNCVWITEIWDSKNDHDASLKNEKTKELITKAMPLLESAPEKGQELEFIGGFGI